MENNTKKKLLIKELIFFVRKSLKEKIHYKWRNIIFCVMPVILTIFVNFYVAKSFNFPSRVDDFNITSKVNYPDLELKLKCDLNKKLCVICFFKEKTNDSG